MSGWFFGGFRMRWFLIILVLLFTGLLPHGFAAVENSSITTEDLIRENDLVLEQNPQNITALLYRALIYYNGEKYPDAISSAERVLKTNQNNSFAWHIIGSSWGNLGNYSQSADAFSKAAALAPGDPAEYNVQGVALSRLGKNAEAIDVLKKALELDPGYAVAWNNLGVTYRYMNETDKAIDAFNKAIERDPKPALFYSNKGYALLDKRDYSGAINCASTAKKIEMTSVPQWFVAGDAYYAQQDYENAFYSYDGGFTTMEKNDLWYYQGVKNSRITKKMEPVDAYYQSVSSNVRFTGEWDRKTVLEYKLKRYQNTLDVYDQVMAISPNLLEGWKRKGFCALKLEKFESGRDSYERALEIRPNDTDALASYGYALGKLGDYLGGMKSIQDALKGDPTFARGYVLKGEIHSMYGERKDAESSFAKAVELDPHNPDIFNAFVGINMKNGDYIGATINFFRAAIGF